jgi:hypothetical protein
MNKYDYASETDRYIWTDSYGNKTPYLYEEITFGYTNLKYGLLKDYYYREESSKQIYRYNGSSLTKVSKEPAYHPVIVIPDAYFDWFFQ